MTTITLTLTVTEAERAALVARFIDTAQAVTGEIDDGLPGDPNGSKVDTAGVVWDARYHGANMSKNQDGTWRRKKNLSAQEKTDADNYEAGCKGAPTATAQAAVGVAQPATAPAPDVPAFLQTGTFAPTATAPIMGMPGLPAAAPTYAELISVFQATIARVGQTTVDGSLAAIYQAAGVTDMKQLETDENVRRAIKTSLEQLA
ncbi:hypothetical protein G6M87_10850 [Rhizobium rhizogenes]|uniref:hypothetical protein n=1 Tax=Rhizobium rhizogenes TaxID=359 RepID=UPI0015721F5E|nr:hypothetical protein [Rhizobium rhizogenes]NTI22355.1 hypothetical protein [Rhizobium rhizogenes]QTG05943.1 hypothetical protein G6M87_10850 [Rhizobium rhizogenes]